MTKPLLIILCALTVTAWGQDQFTAPSGNKWILAEDSTPILYVCPKYGAGCLVYHPPDTTGWTVFLTWRQVEEEPDSEIEIALTNVATWDARLPDIEILDTIYFDTADSTWIPDSLTILGPYDIISDTVIDSIMGTDTLFWDNEPWCIGYETIQFRIRCREVPGKMVEVKVPCDCCTSNAIWGECPGYKIKRFYEIVQKCDTTEVK